MARKSGGTADAKVYGQLASKMKTVWSTRAAEMAAYVTEAKRVAALVAANKSAMKGYAARMKVAAAAFKDLAPKIDQAAAELKEALKSADKAEITKKRRAFEALDMEGQKLEQTIAECQGGFWGQSVSAGLLAKALKLSNPQP